MSDVLTRLFSLAGKTVLLTGASGGIGGALALGLAEAGARVAIHGRSEEKLAQVKAQIEAAGGRAVALTADLAEVAACRQLVDDAHAALGRLDVLINCAAMNRRKPVTEVTEEDYDTIMAVNLRSAYFLSQQAQPLMKAQGGGKIIHIGSLNTAFALDTVSVYGATKGGLTQMTKAMAVEWADDNIQVNCIMPGLILTPLTEQALWRDPLAGRWFRHRISMRRPGNPEELVGVTLLLAGQASSYITGTTITVDGGFLAGGSWHRDEG